MSLFNDPTLSDISLILRNEKQETTVVYAHKAILANQSDYFKALFTSNFSERDKKTVSVFVPDIPEALYLLEWFYTHDPALIPVIHEELETSEVISESLPDMWLVRKFMNRGREKYPFPRNLFRLVTEDNNLMHFISSTNDGITQLYVCHGNRRLDIGMYLSEKIEDTKYFEDRGIFFPNDSTFVDIESRQLLIIFLNHHDFDPEDRMKLIKLLDI